MSWSKIKTKFRKPIGWWYHKILCELMYYIFGGNKYYYNQLKKMCDKYMINLYGEKL